MNRPIYETPDDRNREEAAAQRFLKCLRSYVKNITTVEPRLSLRHTPNLNACDRLIYRDYAGTERLVGNLEIKVRSCAREQYPTYMIGLSKILNNVLFADAMGARFFLCVQWTDSLGFVEIDKSVLSKASSDLYDHDVRIGGVRLEKGGRTDRGDSRDVEEVLHIDISRFRSWDNEEAVDDTGQDN